MLTARARQRCGAARPVQQRGVVLLLALIVLVAMTLAGLGLMRSVFTSNRVAGNLAFQQAATQSADIGVETAIAWLENNNTGTRLYSSIDAGSGEPVGYSAVRQDPAAGQSWEQFWELLPANRINTLPADGAGNTVAYVIQRLCTAAGDPATGIGCELSPRTTGSEGNSRSAGAIALQAPSQIYYRITSRVTGPRNTVSFVQVVVSL
jgi:Tfp pilus assembly protein PilX